MTQNPPSPEVAVELKVSFRASGSELEDLLVDYDEMTVAAAIKELIDKGLSCEDIQVEVADVMTGEG